MKKKKYFRKNTNFNIMVRDNANGWHDPKALENTKFALQEAIRSHDLENQSKTGANDVIREYNEYLSLFPNNLIGKIFGFRLWKQRKRMKRHR
ncbi:MAG: hypothetical protein QY317_16470 [Candidatus Jettenia caeni]|nr:MAG: hypothetical protein QY317_16470 [Candidatus Jettenia caeni]